MNDKTNAGKPGDQTGKADPKSDSPIDQGQGGQTQAGNDTRNQPVSSGGEATGNGPAGPGGAPADAKPEPPADAPDSGPNTSDDLRR